MRYTQFLRGGDELTGVIGIDSLYLPIAAEPLECFARTLVGFVLDRDTSDKARIQIFDVYCILVTSHSVFLALLVGHQVIRSDNFTPLFGFSFVRTCKMSLCCPFALAALWTVPVERLVP